MNLEPVKKYLELAEKATIPTPEIERRIDKECQAWACWKDLSLDEQNEVWQGYWDMLSFGYDQPVNKASRTMGPALAKALIRAIETLKECYRNDVGPSGTAIDAGIDNALADIEKILGET